MPIPFIAPIPTNARDFELLCLELLRKFWALPSLALYGKSGEEQNGVDIIDLGGAPPLHAAQCKLKEPDKSLPPAEIQAEVDKAKTFELTIGKYAILTSGKVSAQSQRKILEINQLHKSSGLFEVELFTWDRISLLLQNYPEIYEQAFGDGLTPTRAARLESKMVDIDVTIKDGFESLAAKESGDSIDAQIDDARNYLTSGDFQITTVLLNRLERTRADQLTPRHKFRIASNHGAAALGSGQVKLAAKYFLQAVGYQPEDEQALVNEVFAYMLVGDTEQSYTKAGALRGRFPASGRLAALWIVTAPQSEGIEQLESGVNAILRTDPEVALALARKALAQRKFEIAEKYCQIARQAPKWSQPLIVLAQIAVGRALFGRISAGGSSKELVKSAEELCTAALTLAEEEKDRYATMTSLSLRADARLMLGRTEDALSDARRAELIDAEDASVLLGLGQSLSALEKHDEAIESFRKANRIHHRADVAFLLGRALRARARSGDSDEALEVMREITLTGVPTDIRSRYVMEVIQLFIHKRDWSGARDYLRSARSLLPAATSLALDGCVSHFEGNQDEAAGLAQQAARELTTASDSETKEFLARLFMFLGRPDEALALWKEAFIAGREGFDPANYLNCAAKLRRDDLVMEACEILRERGTNTWELLEFELSYLTRYKIGHAIELLQSFIRDHPEDRIAKLHLSLIGAHLYRSDLIQASSRDIPTVEELPLDLAVPTISLLKQHGDHVEAVKYAYEYLRRHFQELEAHRALIVAVMGGTLPTIPPTLEVVGPNAAVCYQEVPDGRPIWVVLEDTQQLNADFEEIELNSDRARALIGKRVGDTVVLAKGTIQDRLARILQIVPKYVRRFQDSMEQLPIRFGPASGVESIRIAPTDEDPAGLKPILSSIELRAEEVERIHELYREQPISLHLIGARFGYNAYVALKELVWRPDVGVKCCQGSAEERARALQSLQTARIIIVDITALCTLRLLGLLEVLKSTKFEFVVAESTIVELRHMLARSAAEFGDGLTMAYHEGKHVGYKTTAESKKELRQLDQEFVHFVESNVRVENAPAFAALEPDRRTTLLNGFGAYGTESILLAGMPDRVLWTDDSIQAQLAGYELGINRVWTQFVLEAMAAEGVLSPDKYAEATALLVGMNFLITTFGADSIIAGFKLAEWSPKNFPVNQFQKVLTEVPEEVLVRMFLEVTRTIYRESLTSEIRCVVTVFFLELLAARPEGDVRIPALRQVVTSLFGLNFVGSSQFQACFDRWVKSRREPIIVVPD
jgi:tetratricopeptide (TPR) repeat protein